MDPSETIKYLRLIAAYLHQKWLETGDPSLQAELEAVEKKIAELTKHSGYSPSQDHR